MSGEIDDIASGYVAAVDDSNTIDLTLTPAAGGAKLSADVKVVASAENAANTLSATANGLRSFFTVDKTENTGVYTFKDPAGNAICNIDTGMDAILSGAEYDSDTDVLTMKFNTLSGTQSIDVDLKNLLDLNDIVAGNGITTENVGTSGKSFAVKLDTTSEDAKYFILGEDGLGLSGITSAINAANSGLESKISAAFVANKIAIGTTDGLTSSEFTLITDTTSATVADGTANVIADAAAVKAYVDDNDDALKAELSALVSGAYTANKIVVGTGSALSASAFEIDDATDKLDDADDAAVPTDKAVGDYITASV